MADIVFDSEIEEFLSENHGNLLDFYGFIAGGTTVGAAFKNSLSQPHKYMLQRIGKMNRLASEIEFDSELILEVIEALKVETDKYPEDHPIWSVR